MKFLPLVFSNLKRNKFRTILTVLSIFIAFLLFGFLCAMKEAFLGGPNIAGADRLIVRNKIAIIQPLPKSYENRIASIEGVDAVASQSWFGGIYQDPKNFFSTIPVDPDSFMDLYPEFLIPEDQKEAWRNTRNGAIVGRTTMERFNWKLGDTIPLTSPIWGQPANESAWQLSIVGVYDAEKKGTDLTTLYFRYDFFDEGRQEIKGQIGWFGVRVKNPDDAAAVAERIDEEFMNSPFETKAEAEGAFAASFAQQVGDIAAIVTGIIAAVFFTILLVTGNTVSQSVRERTEELGVLKAMGFTSGRILSLVLTESCVIALLGGVGGVVCAWLVTTYSNPAPTTLPTLNLPARDLLLGLALAAALGLVSGAIPAVQAMRLQISIALRRNG